MSILETLAAVLAIFLVIVAAALTVDWLMGD